MIILSAKYDTWKEKKDALDDILPLELLQQTDLADRGARHAFVPSVQPYLLQGDDSTSVDMARLVDDTVCAWARGKG